MWAIRSADSGFCDTHPDSGYVPRPCVATAVRRAACKASIDSGVCGYKCGGHCYGVAGRPLLPQIWALLERLYARQGYRTDALASRAESPHRIPFAGAHEGRLFATITLGLDSADGLLVDELYHAEVDVFRRMKRRICDLSAFAVDPEYSSRDVLATLFYLAYVFGRKIHGVTDAFIEVNPRHAGFYERVFAFRRVGDTRECPRVAAPAVLMHLDLERVNGRSTPADTTGSAAGRTPSTSPLTAPRNDTRSPALAHL